MTGESDAEGGSVGSQFTKQNLSIQEKILDNERSMTEATRQRYEWELEILKLKQEQVREANKDKENAASSMGESFEDLGENVKAVTVNNYSTKQGALGAAEAASEIAQKGFSEAGKGTVAPEKRVGVQKTAEKSLKGMEKAATTLEIADIPEVKEKLAEAQEAVDNFAENSSSSVENLIVTFDRLKAAIMEVGAQEVQKAEDALVAEMDNSSKKVGPELSEGGLESLAQEETTFNKDTVDERKKSTIIPTQTIQEQIVEHQTIKTSSSQTGASEIPESIDQDKDDGQIPGQIGMDDMLNDNQDDKQIPGQTSLFDTQPQNIQQPQPVVAEQQPATEPKEKENKKTSYTLVNKDAITKIKNMKDEEKLQKKLNTVNQQSDENTKKRLILVRKLNKDKAKGTKEMKTEAKTIDSNRQKVQKLGQASKEFGKEQEIVNEIPTKNLA